MKEMRTFSRRWKYKNSILLIVSLATLFMVADTEVAHALLREIGTYGYLGAFVAGIFFVSTFTVAPASVVLFHLAQNLNPGLIAICAGAGGVIGDLLIFRFLKDGVYQELRPVFKKYGGHHLARLFKTPYFAWLAPVVGAVIIASPLPDEVGIALMGFSRIKLWQFVALAFILDALGILAVVLLARSI